MIKKYQVSEITNQIKHLLENTFQESVIVAGEISNFSSSPSGHLYFSLKDEKSQIKVVFFKRFVSLLRDYKPKNGDRVEVMGDITVYEPDGTYQIMGKKIEYDSAGKFYKIFEETKKKLEAEGLFENKKAVKEIVKNIALFTSPTGAAIKDFLATLKKNRTGVNVHLWPVQVQGNSAIPEIIKSIKKANRYPEKYDLLVLMRGGGSLEDLIIFNDEGLARALNSSKIPTMSAIGHERDFTICDFTADLRVSTPTAAGEYISGAYLKKANLINEWIYKTISSFNGILAYRLIVLDKFLSVLDSKNPKKIIENKLLSVDNHIKNLNDKIRYRIKDLKNSLSLMLSSIESKSPLKKIGIQKHLLEILLNDQKNRITIKLTGKNVLLEKNIERLKLLNPENVLERGYAIVYSGKLPVTSADKVRLEDNIEIKLKNGYIDAFVTGKKMEDLNGKNSNN